MIDYEKTSPKKIDINMLKIGLSIKQANKIEYECDLLRISVDRLLLIAPHLFSDEESLREPEPETEEEYVPEKTEDVEIDWATNYEGYYDDSGY